MADEVPDLWVTFDADSGRLEIPLEPPRIVIDDLPGTVGFRRVVGGQATSALWLTTEEADTLARMVTYCLGLIDRGELRASEQGTANLRAVLPRLEALRSPGAAAA